ncbi:MAG: SPOR domain-containing protein [Proteobacteria bacterium]|nr:SPOR domain-containing protein [Pseudomonadota bacterium]
MNLFSLSFSKRFFLCFTLIAFALTVSLSACSSKPAEEVKVSKRMKIEHPKKAPAKKVVKKVVKKKVVKKKVVKTAKPDVKWVSPKKATIKRKKSVVKPKPVPVKTASVVKTKPAPVKKATVAKKSSSVSKAAQSGTNYVVSLSSFTDRGKAATLASKLRNDGYNAYVTEHLSKGTMWYRVRCGFFDGYTEATKVKDKLEKRYFAKGAWVDKPSSSEVAQHAK